MRHATVALEEPDDFGRFAVIDGTGDDAGLGEAIAGHGRLTDGGDVFVAIDALLALAGERADDPAWRAGFDQMVAFARGHGWLDEAGTAVRAHVEPLG
ncbi:hypothetical protein [Conexibacter arvalis]|uniref:Uncharacterized protein n=1 Tax=Conexibacter arvalis TaxID=912552 RepID=A0A840IE03_9ACTN|nr:hypothetical protein [Conexibacter arvalis]MBB4662170.1 hypothetical protein [Conexibacter arvalis]